MGTARDAVVTASAPTVADEVGQRIIGWTWPAWQTWEGGFLTWCPPTPRVLADEDFRQALRRIDFRPMRPGERAAILQVNGHGYLVRGDPDGGDEVLWAHRREIVQAARQRLILGFPAPRPCPPSTPPLLPPLTFGTLALRIEPSSCTCVALQALDSRARSVHQRLAAIIGEAWELYEPERSSAAFQMLERLYPLMDHLLDAFDTYLQQPRAALPLVEGNRGRALTQQRYQRSV